MSNYDPLAYCNTIHGSGLFAQIHGLLAPSSSCNARLAESTETLAIVKTLTRIPKVSDVSREKMSDEDPEIVCTIRRAHLVSDVTTLKLFSNLRISASSVLCSEYLGNNYNVRFYPSGEISGNARDNFRLPRAKERALDNSFVDKPFVLLTTSEYAKITACGSVRSEARGRYHGVEGVLI